MIDSILFVQTVRQSGGGRLLQDAGNLDASIGEGFYGGYSLSSIKLGWDGNNGSSDVLVAQKLLRYGYQMIHNVRSNLRRCDIEVFVRTGTICGCRVIWDTKYDTIVCVITGSTTIVVTLLLSWCRTDIEFHLLR
mmetsp:Transcript_26997/g.59991  ORF Transcript_26997/g.59991 Transcript_26997/m.59991 type:complete len:135 (+) Transcript_26997:1530-1934(+)